MQARTGGNENSGQYRQVSFYDSVMFLENVEQIEIMHTEQKYKVYIHFYTIYLFLIQ